MNHRLRYLAAILIMTFPASVQAANQWSHAQRLTVVMVDNHFQPDHLTFQTGHPYDLRLENHGKYLHEFTAPAFLKSTNVRDKRLLANGGTDVVVQPGKSIDIFLIPHAKGEYTLTCADHDWDGMTGSITVN
jgi:uncharacterized cupredoxin-like copper-binding protein